MYIFFKKKYQVRKKKIEGENNGMEHIWRDSS